MDPSLHIDAGVKQLHAFIDECQRKLKFLEEGKESLLDSFLKTTEDVNKKFDELQSALAKERHQALEKVARCFAAASSRLEASHCSIVKVISSSETLVKMTKRDSSSSSKTMNEVLVGAIQELTPMNTSARSKIDQGLISPIISAKMSPIKEASIKSLIATYCSIDVQELPLPTSVKSLLPFLPLPSSLSSSTPSSLSSSSPHLDTSSSNPDQRSSSLPCIPSPDFRFEILDPSGGLVVNSSQTLLTSVMGGHRYCLLSPKLHVQQCCQGSVYAKFKIRKMLNNYWLFVGISGLVPPSSNSVLDPSVFGWAGSSTVWMQGKGKSHGGWTGLHHADTVVLQLNYARLELKLHNDRLGKVFVISNIPATDYWIHVNLFYKGDEIEILPVTDEDKSLFSF